ncbi:MAG: carboxymuconolactone decarboxylase family protein [Nocardioidaceae bacterium]
MTRVPVHTVDSAPEASRDTLKSLEARFGKVLNIHGAMAHSPLVLDAYAALQHSIGEHGTFDGRTREAIALAVAAVDQCSYCQAAHTAGGKAAGLSEAETIDARRGTSSDPKLQALLTVVREQMTDLGNISDTSWQAGLAAGWTDAQLAESTVHVSLNVLTNYFNHTVQTDLDLPPAPAL